MNACIASTSLALFLAAGFAATPLTSPATQAHASGKYKVDTEHSTVLLRVKHLNTSWTFLRFDTISGEFSIDPAHPEAATFKVQLAAASIDSNNANRDSDVKSPHFLDATKYPDVTFTSKSVQKSGDGKYKAEGDLSLHGVTKTITVELEETGASETQFGTRAGFYGSFSVQRKDFGINYMSDAVGDEIQATVSIEGVRADAKSK
jgi:polyisoprenoid-binding protein YceI